MILDSSAIVAIVFREPGHGGVLEAIGAAPSVAIGAPTLVEAGIVLAARLGAEPRGLLSRFLLEGDVAVVPFTERSARSPSRMRWLRPRAPWLPPMTSSVGRSDRKPQRASASRREPRRAS